jgi:hypothetical protein
MSDRRLKPVRGREGPVDDVERRAAEELDTRPSMPLLVAPATSLGCQAVRLGDGSPGVTVTCANAVVTASFPMDRRQARQHIDDIERCLLEAEAIPPGATE